MIIGLTGYLASGKSTVVNALKGKGFNHITLSSVVRKACRESGLEEVRDNLVITGEKLRREHGAGVLGKLALEELTKKGGDKWIVDGIRNPAEVDELRIHPDFVLIANTAPEELIVERVLSRKRADDTLDRESILFKLHREMGVNQPPEGQQVKKCIEMADYRFENTMPMDEVEAEFLKLYETIK